MRTLRNTAKILIPIILLVIIFAPAVSYAREKYAPGQTFIPCGFDRPDDDDAIVSGPEEECGFDDLLRLVKKILDWIVLISFPISVITLSWAGFILLTTGIADKRSEAKSMLWKVVIGFAVILSAWLIVKILVNVILEPGRGDQFIELNQPN